MQDQPDQESEDHRNVLVTEMLTLKKLINKNHSMKKRSLTNSNVPYITEQVEISVDGDVNVYNNMQNLDLTEFLTIFCQRFYNIYSVQNKQDIFLCLFLN